MPAFVETWVWWMIVLGGSLLGCTGIIMFWKWCAEEWEFMTERRVDAEKRLVQQRDYDKALLDLKLERAKKLEREAFALPEDQGRTT